MKLGEVQDLSTDYTPLILRLVKDLCVTHDSTVVCPGRSLIQKQVEGRGWKKKKFSSVYSLLV